MSDLIAPLIHAKQHRRLQGWYVFCAFALLAPIAAWGAHATLGLSLKVSSWPAAVWFLLGAPIVEEWIFRHGLQQGLLDRGFSARIALIGTAAVFAACHYPQSSFLSIWWVIPGVALGLMWECCGRRLWPGMVLHAWFNVVLTINS